MGFITDLLGITGGKGADFQAQGVNGDQSNAVFQNAQQALAQQNAFAQALAGQNGIGNQSNVLAQQQQLANQFQNIGNGQGPNPALAQLNQQTGNNIAAQAALMAGQRGAGANPGMIGRQIANQGANIQQQAVGQGATMQAQQQLAGLSALQNQQAMMQGLTGQQVAQQQGALNAGAQSALAGQQNVYGMQANQNSANSGVAQQNAKSQAGGLGGVLSGIGSIIGLADGGSVPDSNGPQSRIARHLIEVSMKNGGRVPGKAQAPGDDKKNDTVPAMLSPGEIVVPRSAAKNPEKAAMFAAAVARRSKKGKK